MAFAALGIGVGVLLLSFGLVSGGVACTTTTTIDIDIDIDININDAVVGCNDEVSSRKTSSSSCYLSQHQQPQPEQLRKMEEEEKEEAADDGFITSGLKSDDQQSEILILLPTAAATTGKREEEAAAAAAVVDPAAPLNLFTNINMKESLSPSPSSWMRKKFFFRGNRMKKLVSEICGRAKRGVRRWEAEVVEWWCYLKVKGPDFWDGKKGRISREILWVVADLLLEASTNRDKGPFLSTAHLQMFVRQLYTILKTNFK